MNCSRSLRLVSGKHRPRPGWLDPLCHPAGLPLNSYHVRPSIHRCFCRRMAGKEWRSSQRPRAQLFQRSDHHHVTRRSLNN